MKKFEADLKIARLKSGWGTLLFFLLILFAGVARADTLSGATRVLDLNTNSYNGAVFTTLPSSNGIKIKINIPQAANANHNVLKSGSKCRMVSGVAAEDNSIRISDDATSFSADTNYGLTHIEPKNEKIIIHARNTLASPSVFTIECGYDQALTVADVEKDLKKAVKFY